MSLRCLLLATADVLRETMQLDMGQCKVMADGMPPPLMGQFFLAVHPGQWRRDRHLDYSLGERLGLQVTLTWRVTRTPEDKWGTLELAAALTGAGNKPGFIARLEQARAALHMNYDLLKRANALLGTGVTVNGFDGGEPLEFIDSGSPPRRVGGAWLSAKQERSRAALVQTMTFDGALRIQAVQDGLA